MTTEKRTVCFADMDRFNVAVRNMLLEDMVAFLQGFYERAGNIALSHNGRLIKYMGDSTLITFGPGLEEVAVRAMWTLRNALKEYVEGLEGEAGVARLRVGVATGQVVAGQVGHPQILAYDVLGKPVMIAHALLECGGVTMDGNTREAVSDHVVTEVVETGGQARGYRVTGFR